MPSSRFSGLYLSGRALAVILVVVGVSGAMAFYRTRSSPAMAFQGAATSNQGPIPASQVAALTGLDKEQELLAQYVAPAVVTVTVTAHATSSDEGMPGDNSGDQGGGQGGGGGQGAFPPDNPLSQFFGQFGQMPRRPEYEQGLGSGIIISPDGFIVTNNHVVDGATSITVGLYDKRTFYDAKVVGTDPLTDLAVIKINASGLPNLPWGDSKAIKQGDNVFAFGNPFQFEFTMTRGIVSGKGRLAGDRTDLRAPGDYIQTDAAINPGNSGGPLVNTRGEVIGVNAFIYTSTGSFNGEAFAIPSEIAKPITATLIAKGKVVRGFLGITIVSLTPDMAHFFNLPATATGALVSQVSPGEAGAKGGLQHGDLITSFNGQPVADPTGLQLATGAVAPGTTVKLGIMRDGKPMTLSVTLGLAPQDQTQTASRSHANAPGAGVRLGLDADDLTPTTRRQFQIPDNIQGALIRTVTPGGPAYNATLQPGMVITEVNRVPVPSAEALTTELQKLPPNQDVLLRVVTGGGAGGAVYMVVHPAASSSNSQ
ncbi:MAG TPA: trypsin-like peptidase domain-containing protein [Terriglobales bacterium]|jgi:serine protease Do